MRTLVALMIAVGFASAELPSADPPPKDATKAREMIRTLETGGSFDDNIVSGGALIMSNDGKRKYYTGDLNVEARALKNLGGDAFPQIFSLLDHEEQYMRYIASSALSQLTNWSPGVLGFQARGVMPKTPEERSQVCRLAWIEWYQAWLRNQKPNKPRLGNPLPAPSRDGPQD